MCILTSFLRLLFHSFSSLFLFSSFFLPSFVPFLIVFFMFLFPFLIFNLLSFLLTFFFSFVLYYCFLPSLTSPFHRSFIVASFLAFAYSCFHYFLRFFFFSLAIPGFVYICPPPFISCSVFSFTFFAFFAVLSSLHHLLMFLRFFFFFLWLLHYLTFSSLSGPAAAASIPSPSQSAGRELFPTTCSFFLYPSSSLSLAPSLLPPVFSIQKNTDLYNETWPYAILFHGGFKRSLWPWVIEKHLFNWARILFPWPCNNLMNRVVRQWMGPVPHSNCLAQSSGTSLVNRGH